MLTGQSSEPTPGPSADRPASLAIRHAPSAYDAAFSHMAVHPQKPCRAQRGGQQHQAGAAGEGAGRRPGRQRQGGGGAGGATREPRAGDGTGGRPRALLQAAEAPATAPAAKAGVLMWPALATGSSAEPI